MRQPRPAQPASKAIDTFNYYLDNYDLDKLHDKPHQALSLDYGNKIEDLNRDFFEEPIRTKGNTFLRDLVTKMLNDLNVPKEEQERYLNSTATVYGLLKILSERAKKDNPKGNEKIDAFIKQLENYQLVNTLKFLKGHFEKGGSKEALLEYMESYDKKMAKVNTDFYKTTVNSDKEVRTAVEDLLTSLGIPKMQWGRYTGSSKIREMLKEIVEYAPKTDANKEKIEQVKSLVADIKAKSKVSLQKAILYGLGVLFPILATMPFGGFGVIEQIVTAALFIPVVSVAVTIGVALYSIYKTTFDKNIPLLDKIRDNFFLVAGTALKTAAYGLVIAAGVASAPVVGILTVVAAGVDVLQEGFKLLQMKIKGKAAPARTGNEDLITKQQDARFDADYAKSKKLLWVKLGTAVALTALAAVTSFVPGGIIVVAAAALAMGIVYAIQWKANKNIEKASKKALHAKFAELEAEEQNKPQPKDELSSGARLIAGLQHGPEVVEGHRAVSESQDAIMQRLGSVEVVHELGTESPSPSVRSVRSVSSDSSDSSGYSSDEPTVTPLSRASLKDTIPTQAGEDEGALEETELDSRITTHH